MAESIPQQKETREPEMPRVMMKLMNPLMALMLRSPLHGRMSGQLMLLTVVGRKSGKEYTFPVGYVQAGDDLLLFTHGNWWKNLRGGAMVEVRLRGQTRRGQAELVEDQDEALAVAQAISAAHGPKMARRLGVYIDPAGDLQAQIEQILGDTTFVRVHLI